MIDIKNYNDDAFECEFEQDTAIITLKKKAFSVNFETSFLHSFLDCLNEIEMDDKVKGVLIIDPPAYHGVENVRDFIELLHSTKGSYQKEKGVTRYGNTSKRLTLTLNDFSKPIISGIEGRVPIDSFGYFMACDNIIVTDDLKIEFPGLELGVTPIGAVSFYLEREIGPRKTLDMFLSGESLDGVTALELGMVSQIVTKDQLKQACLDKLQHYYSHPEQTVIMTKQLIKARSYDLERFFERSIRLMWNAVLNK
ncbi:MAG: enoyl-CoA hydratase/isomerase family protein [Pseudomonadota bacterium]